jgi:hypothetical protein
MSERHLLVAFIALVIINLVARRSLRVTRYVIDAVVQGRQ